MSLLSFLMIDRSDVKTTILRASGTLYQMRNDKLVSNLYNAELVNKTSRPLEFEIVPEDKTLQIQYIQKQNKLEYGGRVKLTFFVLMPQNSVKMFKSKIKFKLLSDGKVIDNFETTFIAPPNN